MELVPLCLNLALRLNERLGKEIKLCSGLGHILQNESDIYFPLGYRSRAAVHTLAVQLKSQSPGPEGPVCRWSP